MPESTRPITGNLVPSYATHLGRTLTDLNWWQWAVTVPLIALHLTGMTAAMPAAVALCVGSIPLYLWRTGSFAAQAVQIRIAYMAMLLGGLTPAFAFLHWVQLLGTSAMVLVGYCLLGRCISLLPWNRRTVLSTSLVVQTFLAPPAGGGVFRVNPATDRSGPDCMCSG